MLKRSDEFAAFLELQLGRKKISRESPCPAIWPLVAALGSLSSVAVMDLLHLLQTACNRSREIIAKSSLNTSASFKNLASLSSDLFLMLVGVWR